MRKLVSIYERSGKYFVSSENKTTAGFWVPGGTWRVAAAGDGLLLQEHVISALSESQQDVPPPPRSADLLAPLFVLAGVKTWNTFMRSAKTVNVELEGDLATVTPYKNLGAREGYEPDMEKVRTVSKGGDLGAAVVAAFADAT